MSFLTNGILVNQRPISGRYINPLNPSYDISFSIILSPEYTDYAYAWVEFIYLNFTHLLTGTLSTALPFLAHNPGRCEPSLRRNNAVHYALARSPDTTVSSHHRTIFAQFLTDIGLKRAPRTGPNVFLVNAMEGGALVPMSRDRRPPDIGVRLVDQQNVVTETNSNV